MTERDGRTLIHCHAGCAQGDVIDALRSRGLWPSRDDDAPRPKRRQPRLRVVEPTKLDADALARADAARAIWNAARPAAGALVETYLRARSIALPVPPVLRFAPALRHGPSGRDLPAMVAAVQDAEGSVAAIHRTYLRHGGTGKADVSPNKLALGPIADGAVRLAPAGAELGIAEGIETALSAAELYSVPTWAALGARLHAIAIPAVVRRVHVFADNGSPGMACANRTVAAYTRQGRDVLLRFPPRGYGDWNDALAALRREGVAA